MMKEYYYLQHFEYGCEGTRGCANVLELETHPERNNSTRKTNARLLAVKH